jgi:transcriptional regulator with PAS, ATPase and Fis domain
MIRLALLVPCKDFIPDALQLFHQFIEQNLDAAAKEYVLDEVVLDVDEIYAHKFNNYDVIIARGLLSESTKRIYPELTIIEIPLLGTDLLRALMTCKKQYKSRNVAVIASNNMISGAEKFADILDLNIKTFKITGSDSRKVMIKKAAESGCDAIVGGFNTCVLGKKLGMDCVTITTGPDTFWQCLIEAHRLAQISRREQEKTQRTIKILDYSWEGILSLNTEQEVITINKQAEKILNQVGRIAVGVKISDLNLPRALKICLVDNREYYNEVVSADDLLLNVNKVVVRVKNQVTGWVITFQHAWNIMELETKIRNTIYSKGHFAKHTFEDIIGSSPAITRAISIARRYAKNNSTILLLGRSGTGKEIFAQSIHNVSLRANRAFVAVNCAAVPEHLLESELFGYVDGAFTGAVKSGKAGYFEMAHEGTLFLDEIGEMPISLQAKLLRVIQEREIIRLGDNVVRSVDIRLICATNCNLENLVIQGKFREDLFYRLNVLSLAIPNLDDRTGDIPMIANSFFSKFYPHITVELQATELLKQYHWSGNVRQLLNCCEKLAVLSENGKITEEDVEREIGVTRVSPQRHMSPGVKYSSERECIIEALQKAHFNRTKAADILGFNRSTLWRKMQQYQI